MKTMTIRNIPDEVARFLSGKAASEGRSVNATTVSLLSRVAGVEPRQSRRRDLTWLAGSWSAEEARRFDATVASCRKIDERDWK